MTEDILRIILGYQTVSQLLTFAKNINVNIYFKYNYLESFVYWKNNFCEEQFNFLLKMYPNIKIIRCNQLYHDLNSKNILNLVTKVCICYDSYINLQKLSLIYCSRLNNIDNMSALCNLKLLKIDLCINLLNINGISKIRNLKSLEITHCYDLRQIQEIQKIINLKKLKLAYLIKNDVLAITNLKHLTHITFTHMPHYKICGKISKCIKYLNVNDIQYLDIPKNIKHVSLSLVETSINNQKTFDMLSQIPSQKISCYYNKPNLIPKFNEFVTEIKIIESQIVNLNFVTSNLTSLSLESLCSIDMMALKCATNLKHLTIILLKSELVPINMNNLIFLPLLESVTLQNIKIINMQMGSTIKKIVIKYCYIDNLNMLHLNKLEELSINSTECIVDLNMINITNLKYILLHLNKTQIRNKDVLVNARKIKNIDIDIVEYEKFNF